MYDIHEAITAHEAEANRLEALWNEAAAAKERARQERLAEAQRQSATASAVTDYFTQRLAGHEVEKPAVAKRDAAAEARIAEAERQEALYAAAEARVMEARHAHAVAGETLYERARVARLEALVSQAAAVQGELDAALAVAAAHAARLLGLREMLMSIADTGGVADPKRAATLRVLNAMPGMPSIGDLPISRQAVNSARVEWAQRLVSQPAAQQAAAE